MALESLRLTITLCAPPERVYAAWLSSAEHSKMIRSEATIEPEVGGKHTAWGDYISGSNLILEPGKRIVQTWRTSEFPEGAVDSKLEVLFEPAEDGGTRLTIVHTDIYEGGAESYEQGWKEYYFKPMQKYFKAPARKSAKKAAKPAKKAAKKVAKKPAKKATKKPPKKAVKKAVKPAVKKTATKKAAKKTPQAKKALAKGKKPAKKIVAKKPAKKTAKPRKK